MWVNEKREKGKGKREKGKGKRENEKGKYQLKKGIREEGNCKRET